MRACPADGETARWHGFGPGVVSPHHGRGMDRSSWGFGAKSRLEAPGARSGAAKWTGGFDAAVGWGAPRDGAVVDVRQGLLGCESCACRRVSARRPRQARPGRPSRSVLGQARASSIGWQPLTAYTWDVFALGGGGVVAQACIGVLVGRGIGQLRWFLRPRGSPGSVLRAMG